MLFKYYFWLWLITIVGCCHRFFFFFFCLLVILDCQGGLSCVPLVSFMNFFFFFFFLIMKIIINVFLYLYLLVIKPFNLLSKNTPCSCFGLLFSDCVSCSVCTAHKNLICFVSTLEWCHLIVKAVAKCVIFKSNESKRKSCKMS